MSMIACIPIVSYEIKNGDLDTHYQPPRFTNYEHASVRLVMSMLMKIFDELGNLDYFSKSSLEHFMGTIKKYKDKDVKKLLKNPILKNLALKSNRNKKTKKLKSFTDNSYF